MESFTPDTLIRDVLTSHPEAASVFERLGLGCAACFAADLETLRSVSTMHDVTLETLLGELNALDQHEEA